MGRGKPPVISGAQHRSLPPAGADTIAGERSLEQQDGQSKPVEATRAGPSLLGAGRKPTGLSLGLPEQCAAREGCVESRNELEPIRRGAKAPERPLVCHMIAGEEMPWHRNGLREPLWPEGIEGAR
jgi:hypothetical protein